jgi:carbon storage regulator CsrA
MLSLSRLLGERLRFRVMPDGPDVWLQVIQVDRNKVRVGVTAPANVEIMREELLPPEEKWEAVKGRATVKAEARP